MKNCFVEAVGVCNLQACVVSKTRFGGMKRKSWKENDHKAF